MKKNIILIALISLFHLSFSQLWSENFESRSTGNIATTPGSLYQIDNTDGDCVASDGWRVSTSNAAGTACSGCSGNRGVIDYGASNCQQDALLISGNFTPNCGSTINISFNYGFDNNDSPGAEFFIATLYNETDGVTASTLVNTTVDVDNGSYSSAVAFTSGKTYSLRFQYIGDYDWGATVDNILVTQNGPAATITQNCASNLSYSLSINVTNLAGGTSVNITDGGVTTYYSNVGLGTHVVNGLTGAQNIQITNNLGCALTQSFSACDICSLPTVPNNECSGAPLIDLSQPFYGSTNCSYTASVGSPSACGQSIENDSWIAFIATDDTVSLDFTVGTCTPQNRGIQLSVYSGSCGGLTLLSGSCKGPGLLADNAGLTDNWIFGGMTIGAKYYIRIDGYAGDLCDYYFEPIQGVAILPPNDECIDAIELSCGDSDTSGIVLATAIGAPTSCSGGGTPGKGVWYTVVGTGGDITLSTDNTVTNFDTQINVYTGTCGSFTCVAADDDSGAGFTSSVTFTSVSSTVYYVYVDGDGSAQGSFAIDVSCVSCPADAGTWN